MGDKISIAEVRARRSDPVWVRRHKLADLTGAAVVVLLVVVPALAAALWRPYGLAAAAAAVLVVAPAVLWLRGPTVGLERRAALLVAVPGVNLIVLVPAAWRAAHLHVQRWQGPLEPRWDDSVWRLVGPLAALCWLAGVGGTLALTLA